MESRVAIFIDGSNLYHALRSNFGRHDLNFAEFANRLCDNRFLFRTYYYNILQSPIVRTDGIREQQDFLNALRETPYLEIRLGSTKLSQGVTVEKGVDVMLATDLLHFAWNGLYDIAVLVSGDADYAYALQAVKNMGKHVEVAYFENNISKDLLDIADKRHLLDIKFFKGLWTTQKPPYNRKRQMHSRQRIAPKLHPTNSSVLLPPPPLPLPAQTPPPDTTRFI
jgi:uncharacterized LabA/DUF88 family protein